MVIYTFSYDCIANSELSGNVCRAINTNSNASEYWYINNNNYT